MEEIKFRYCLKNKHTKQLHFKWYFLSEIEKGLNKLFDLENYEIIARDLFIGKQDKNNKDIYTNDFLRGIVEKNPYGQNTKHQECIFLVEMFIGEEGYELNYTCLTKRKSGFNSIPGYQPWEKIGDMYQNPELKENKE